MARFTTRVELYELSNGTKASWQDYENLHSAMAAQGFSRQITGSDGQRYHLPSAEYDKTVNLTATQVRELAFQIASSVWSNPAVLVTEGEASWRGLRLA